MCRGKLKELKIKHLLVFLSPVKSKSIFFNWNIIIQNSTGALISWKALDHWRGFDYIDVIAFYFSWDSIIVRQTRYLFVSGCGFVFLLASAAQLLSSVKWHDLRKGPFPIKWLLMKKALNIKLWRSTELKRVWIHCQYLGGTCAAVQLWLTVTYIFPIKLGKLNINPDMTLGHSIIYLILISAEPWLCDKPTKSKNLKISF